MRRVPSAFALLVATILWFANAQAQSPALTEMVEQFIQLYSQGQYNEAEALAEKALKMSQDQLGSDHHFTAIALNNLAKAEKVYQRVLAILEKKLGPYHPDLATSS